VIKVSFAKITPFGPRAELAAHTMSAQLMKHDALNSWQMPQTHQTADRTLIRGVFTCPPPDVSAQWRLYFAGIPK
jgi:hypothetical protein